MAIEKNRAGWGHTRATRQTDLNDILEKVRVTLHDPTAADDVRGVLFVALVAVRGEPKITQACYTLGGRATVEGLAQAADEVLCGLARSVQDAEEAKRESLVKGRKLDG